VPTPSVQAVLFDYGGVLRHEVAAEFDELAERYGVPPGGLWAAFHDIAEYRLSRTGRLGEAEYRAAVVRELGRWVGPDHAAACLEEWERLRRQDAPIVPAMSELVERLRGRVRLGILSNAGRGARSRLEATGVARRFDDVLCSAEVGLAKPDPAVFRLAAQRLGVPVAACAFVDDLPHNVEGARAVGMKGFLYEPRRHAELLDFLEDLGAL
jgi:putative hydrolase of the HAD superfamily